ncbi:methylated-DNA--[protein]-cysteine S-methyltransferase [Tissierella simiarum]|uniref:methylated-DNA--[protein]-cysteine S-methyltransferase n=1 Tax=Tissierella simiarum TaxID=2841534 RepID=UPI001FE7AAE5|nr:methylated-DNA--[protein]-cysteine S-methyltransferase [Tissierella simiarum]
MDIKYYDFESSIGKINIFFASEGIVCLTLPSDRQEDTFSYIEKRFDIPYKVDKEDYNYHEEINLYLEGKLKKFTLPIFLRGTSFQKKVWEELLNIPYGETRTYKYIAEKIGSAKGYRAVGGALNKNPIAIIVPCHRVIGSNGKLVGFAGGVELKDQLLKLERDNI